MTTEHQLELNVDTIQPDEVYLLYMDVTESWDDSRTEYPYGYDEDCLGFGCGPTIIRYRAERHDKWITGVITDDHTLAAIKERIPEYEKINAAEMEQKVIDPNSKPNYDVKVTYVLEKERRLTL